MDLLVAFRRRFRHVAHVHHAECDVARLVLGAQPVDGLFRVVVGHQLAHAENGQHGAFAGDVQPGRHLGEVPRQVDAADHARRAAGRLHEAAAVGEGALAEHVHVARLVHHLAEQDVAGFEEVRRRLRDPARRHVAGHELHLRKEGVHGALRLLDVVRQGLDGVPRNVRGGTPLPLQGLLVQERRVIEPDLALGAYGVVADAVRARPLRRAPGPAGLVVALRRRIAVVADLDVGQGQAVLARLGLRIPLAVLVHPAEVEVVTGIQLHRFAHESLSKDKAPPGSREVETDPPRQVLYPAVQDSQTRHPGNPERATGPTEGRAAAR